jgi:hypothetical protein
MAGVFETFVSVILVRNLEYHHVQIAVLSLYYGVVRVAKLAKCPNLIPLKGLCRQFRIA